MSSMKKPHQTASSRWQTSPSRLTTKAMWPWPTSVKRMPRVKTIRLSPTVLRLPSPIRLTIFHVRSPSPRLTWAVTKWKVRKLKSTQVTRLKALQLRSGPQEQVRKNWTWSQALMSSMKKPHQTASSRWQTSPSKSTMTAPWLWPTSVRRMPRVKTTRLSPTVLRSLSLIRLTICHVRLPFLRLTWAVKKSQVQRLKSMQVTRQKALQLRSGLPKLASLKSLTWNQVSMSSTK